MLMNSGFAFIPCGGELHFHSFQSSLHEFVIYSELANNLYRFFSTVVMNLARFSFNMFTYSNMNGACLKGVYVSNTMNEINQSKLNQCRSYSAAIQTITRSRNSITCSSICQRTTANMSSCVRQWMAFINIHGRYLLSVL